MKFPQLTKEQADALAELIYAPELIEWPEESIWRKLLEQYKNAL